MFAALLQLLLKNVLPLGARHLDEIAGSHVVHGGPQRVCSVLEEQFYSLVASCADCLHQRRFAQGLVCSIRAGLGLQEDATSTELVRFPTNQCTSNSQHQRGLPDLVPCVYASA